LRNNVIDTSKGILIILVVIGHSDSPFASFIYLFHMASFIFLSGVVFNGDLSAKLYFKKRFYGMYLPYVKYKVLFILAFPIFFYWGLVSFRESINIHLLSKSILDVFFLGGGINELVGPLWFLVLLIEVSTLYFIFYRIVNSIYLLTIIIVIISIVGFLLLSYNIILPRYIGVSLIMLLFFHLGNCYSIYFTHYKLNLLIGVFSLGFLVWISQYVTINIGTSLFGNPFVFVFSCICGIYLLLFIANRIQNYDFSILFSLIGQKTLGILVWHLFFFKILTIYLVYLFDYPLDMLKQFPVIRGSSNFLWVFYSIIGVIGPLILLYLTEKLLIWFKK
jgi:fucose 4-O-acetylase-like acetyltransferase